MSTRRNLPHIFLKERLAVAVATEFGSLGISERISLPRTWDVLGPSASNLLYLFWNSGKARIAGIIQ